MSIYLCKMDEKILLEIERSLTLMNCCDKKHNNLLVEEKKCWPGYEFNSYVNECVKKNWVYSQKSDIPLHAYQKNNETSGKLFGFGQQTCNPGFTMNYILNRCVTPEYSKYNTTYGIPEDAFQGWKQLVFKDEKGTTISQSEFFRQDEKRRKKEELDRLSKLYNEPRTRDPYDYTGGIGVNVNKIKPYVSGSFENPFVKPEVVVGLTSEEKEKIKKIKDKIIEEVEGGWAPWKWGTDEKGLVNSLEYITNDVRYEYLFKLLSSDKKYGNELKYAEAILPWLQLQEFSKGQDREYTNPETGKPWTRNPFDWYQYYTNDKYLFRMQQILSKYNDLEVFESQDVKHYDRLSAEDWKAFIPPAARDALHVGLAIASLIVSFGNSWPAVIASFSIEAVDAAIYKYLDEDDYGAGLALAFAFAGPFDKTLGIFAKTYGSTILKKLVKGGGMTVAEKLGLKYIARNAWKIANLTRMGLILDTIKVAFSKFKTANQILKGVFKISKVLGSFLLKGGLMVGGSFLTWDFMAKKLNICNSMPLSPLKQSDFWVLKLIGGAGEFIQPFSTPCDVEKNKKILEKYQSDLESQMNTRLINWLQQMIDKNIVLSIDSNADIEIPETGVVQVILRYFGYTSTKSPTGKIIELDPFFYDENTKLIVEAFQKDNNLQAKDGMIGPESLKKLKSMVESLGEKQIPKYPGFNLGWSQKQIDKMKAELKKRVEDQDKKDKLNEVVPPTLIESTIVNQKDSIKNDFDNRIKEIPEFTDDDVKLLNNELKKI